MFPLFLSSNARGEENRGIAPVGFFAMGALAPTIPTVGAYASNGAVSHMETGEILRHDHK